MYFGNDRLPLIREAVLRELKRDCHVTYLTLDDGAATPIS
jgi:transcription-repair coupling factor (superfamily II helicase)